MTERKQFELSAEQERWVHIDEVKQLCRDFSSRTGSVYIKDVESSLDGLAALSAPTSMSAEPEQRMETTSEHIARDIREGRFPQRSEPQLIAAPPAPSVADASPTIEAPAQTLSAENRPAQDDVDGPAITADVHRDAQRYRWLQTQRSDVWHEFADIPMNRTDELIDAAIASQSASKEKQHG